MKTGKLLVFGIVMLMLVSFASARVSHKAEQIRSGTYSGSNYIYSNNLTVQDTLVAPAICLDGDCQTSWPAGGSGYWNLDGINLSPLDLSYKVGIGTATPEYKLTIYSENITRQLISSPKSLSQIIVAGNLSSSMIFNPNANLSDPSGDQSGTGSAFQIMATNNETASYGGSLSFKERYGHYAWADVMTIKDRKVGIGTIAPQENLVVAAFGNTTLKVRSFDYQNPAIILHRDGVYRDYRIQNYASNFHIDSSANDGGVWTNRFTIEKDTGRVGIGTTTPNSKLTIGGVGDSGYAIAAESDTQYGALIKTATNIGTGAALWILNNESSLLRVQNNGYVGINITSPQEALDVDGAIRLGTTSTNNEGTIRYVSSSKQFQGYNGSWVVLGGASAGGGSGWVDDNGYVRLETMTDNVGIGTYNPSYKLHVNGTHLTDPALYVSAPGHAQILIASSNRSKSDNIYFNAISSAYNRSYVGFTESTGIFTITHDADIGGIFLTTNDSDSGNVMFMDKEGQVGIGTTTPTYKLDVNGDVSIGRGATAEKYNTTLWLKGENTPYGPYDSFQQIVYSFSSAGSTRIKAYRGGSWATYLQFLTNNQTAGSDSPQVRMHIDANGNVGIGTTTPAEALDVGGAIRLGTTSTNNEGTIRYVSSSKQFQGYNGSWVVLGGASAGGGSGWVDDNGYVRLETSTDSVGIGTATPSGNFDVRDASDNVFVYLGSSLGDKNTTLRLLEDRNSGGTNGGFIRYDGGTNVFNIGVNTAANDITQDNNAISIPRGTGYVGINTTSPRELLTVRSGKLLITNTDAALSGESSTSRLGLITNNKSDRVDFELSALDSSFVEGDSLPALRFRAGTATLTDLAQIQTLYRTSAKGDLAFFTRDGSSLQEVMRVSGDGRVGIGKNNLSENYKMRINATDTLGLRIDSIQPDSAAYLNLCNDQENCGSLLYGGSTASQGIYNNSLVFRNNDSDVMTISNGGNVGIGTTTPQRNFVISNGSQGLEFDPNPVGNLANLISYNRVAGKFSNLKIMGNNTIFGYGTDETQEAMRISSNGNVGIGTNNPESKLQITEDIDSNFYGLLVENTHVGRNAVVEVRNTWTNMSLGQDWLTTTSRLFLGGGTYMSLNTNGTEQMRITAGGNVGIGTSLPQSKLWVEDNFGSPYTSSGNYYYPNGTFITVRNTNDTDAGLAGIKFQMTGDTGANPIGYFAFVDSDVDGRGDFVFGQRQGAGVLYAEQMRLDKDGNLGIGTTNPSAALHINATTGLKIGNTGYTSGGYPWNFKQNSNGDLTFEYDSNEFMRIENSGDVAFSRGNSMLPQATVHINNTLMLEPTDSPDESCDAGHEGTIYYDESESAPCFCNGANWVRFDDGITCT